MPLPIFQEPHHGLQDPLAALYILLVEARSGKDPEVLRQELSLILLQVPPGDQETAAYVRKMGSLALLSIGDEAVLSRLITEMAEKFAAGTRIQGKENYFVSPKKEEKLSFSDVMKNATYSAMSNYIEQQAGSLTAEELLFLRPYLTSVLAVEDRAKYEESGSYLGETYGGYIRAKNDCYTYANVKIHERFENAYEGSDQPLTGTRFNSTSSAGLAFTRLGPGFLPLSGMSVLHLQVGDAVGVNISPNATGSNHWGVVAVVNGEPKIIGRGSSLEIWAVEDFFQYATGVDVVRYGSSDYGQHIEVDASTLLARVVDSKLPQDFAE